MWPSESASSRRPRRHPAAVVGDLELDSVAVALAQNHGHLLGLGVAGRVGEQLTRDREQQRVGDVERLRVDVELDVEASLACRLARHGAESGLEAALFERHRVQRHHRLAQAGDRALDDLVGALDLHAARRRLHQLLVGGEKVLKRVVVDQLSDSPPRRVLGIEHLGDELAACVELLAQRRVLGSKRVLGRAVGGQGPYSSIPRRIASATAAARSETPSFS